MKNNINQIIYYCLKVSEDSGVPLLIMSSPGMGKTSTIELFAEYYGYHLEILRGNSTSENEILGYDVVDQDPESKSTKHLRPSWFNRILEADRRSILFLDEITTASPQVQASLLSLCFDRRVGPENLPKSTIIVSAGNYSQSLSSEFTLIPPMMNRFCIINILPEIQDLDLFLSHFSERAIGVEHNWKSLVFDSFRAIDKEETPESLVSRASEYIERSVRETSKALINGNKGLDLKATDAQGLFNETESILLGFVSLRTLSYLVQATISAYKLFGIQGISGNSGFMKIVEGLVGLGLSRNGPPTVLTKYYYESICQAISSVEKLKSEKILEYETFFRSLVPGEDNDKLLRVYNTLELILKDKDFKKLPKPLELDTMKNILSIIEVESRETVKLRTTEVTQEILAGRIGRWNIVLDIFRVFWEIIEKKSSYKTLEMANLLDSTKNSLVSDMVKLDTYLKYLEKKEPGSKGLLPTLKMDLVV